MEQIRAPDNVSLVSSSKGSTELVSWDNEDLGESRRSPLYAWDLIMVQEWLSEEGLGKYRPLFRDKNVTGEVLLKLNYDNLKCMGITCVSDRSKILSCIKFANRLCIATNTNRLDEKDDRDQNTKKNYYSQNGNVGTNSPFSNNNLYSLPKDFLKSSKDNINEKKTSPRDYLKSSNDNISERKTNPSESSLIVTPVMSLETPSSPPIIITPNVKSTTPSNEIDNNISAGSIIDSLNNNNGNSRLANASSGKFQSKKKADEKNNALQYISNKLSISKDSVISKMISTCHQKTNFRQPTLKPSKNNQSQADINNSNISCSQLPSSPSIPTSPSRKKSDAQTFNNASLYSSSSLSGTSYNKYADLAAPYQKPDVDLNAPNPNSPITSDDVPFDSRSFNHITSTDPKSPLNPIKSSASPKHPYSSDHNISATNDSTPFSKFNNKQSSPSSFVTSASSSNTPQIVSSSNIAGPSCLSPQRRSSSARVLGHLNLQPKVPSRSDSLSQTFKYVDKNNTATSPINILINNVSSPTISKDNPLLPDSIPSLRDNTTRNQSIIPTIQSKSPSSPIHKQIPNLTIQTSQSLLNNDRLLTETENQKLHPDNCTIPKCDCFAVKNRHVIQNEPSLRSMSSTNNRPELPPSIINRAGSSLSNIYTPYKSSKSYLNTDQNSPQPVNNYAYIQDFKSSSPKCDNANLLKDQISANKSPLDNEHNNPHQPCERLSIYSNFDKSISSQNNSTSILDLNPPHDNPSPLFSQQTAPYSPHRDLPQETVPQYPVVDDINNSKQSPTNYEQYPTNYKSIQDTNEGNDEVLDEDSNSNSSQYSSLKLQKSESESSLPSKAFINGDQSLKHEDYIGERPPDELIVDQLEKYFPGIEDDIFTPIECENEDLLQNYDQRVSLSEDENLYSKNEQRQSELHHDATDLPTSQYNVTCLPDNDAPLGSAARSLLQDNLVAPIRDDLEKQHPSRDNSFPVKPDFFAQPYANKPDDITNTPKNVDLVKPGIDALQYDDDVQQRPISKRNFELEKDYFRAKRNYRKSDIQTRAQSAIISKRISKIINRRSNYNANRQATPIVPDITDDVQKSRMVSALAKPSLNANDFVINRRTSSMRMPKYRYKSPLDPENKISMPRNVIRKNSLKRGVSSKPQLLPHEDVHFFPLVPVKKSDIETDKYLEIYREQKRLSQKDAPSILRKVKQRYSKDDSNIAGFLSNARRDYGYANGIQYYDSRKRRASARQQDSLKHITPKPLQENISDAKSSDVYGAMKMYESMEKRNTIISSRFSTYTQQNMSVGFKWRLGKVIGKGAFGTVYIGINITTGDLMAVKRVNIGNDNNITLSRRRRQVESIKREIEFLKEVQHENIVAYFGCASADNTFNVFLEYVSGGSIASCLIKYGAFLDSCVRCFTAQILLGLKYLHSVNIIHRDIKGANVLIDSDGVVKISDFGISKKNKYNQAYLRVTRMSMQGTVPWMAPEVTRGKGYSAKVDIWSLGCLVLEMLTNRNPWYKAEGNVIYLLGKGKAPPIPNDISGDAKNFLSKCFNDNPDLRPTATEILNESNGYCNSKNPLEFDFKAWTNNISLQRASREKNYVSTFESVQSGSNNGDVYY